jgi:TRAP-type C4-dicarboxylate transport system permease large subunit
MILITAPVFLPLVQSAGFNAVWFGILVVIVAEMGLITPPVGMNIFVIRAQRPELSLPVIIKGVTPFLAAQLLLIVTIYAFPATVSWLPSLLLR